MAAWWHHAACRGLPAEMFHPTLGQHDVIAKALAVCSICVVRQACLDAAMEEETSAHDTFGIRGGLTSTQRRALRAKRVA